MNNQQKLILWIAISASFIAFLDGSVINVALPAIAREFSGNLSIQQWVVDAYLISLGSLILIAGSLSDIHGRKRIISLGLASFGITSMLCAIAPTPEWLILSRILQGAAGALLVPSSLALIMSAFNGEQRGKAIGQWTAWTGIAFIVGPLVGGLLVDSGSWRLIFAINALPVLATLWMVNRIEEQNNLSESARTDWIGAVLCSIGLGGTVFALIEQSHLGWQNPIVLTSLAVGLLSLILFVWHEKHTAQPMLPLSLFNQRNFSVGNAATFMVYAGLSLATFVVSIFVQQVGGYSATVAGLALMPITIIMFLLSSKFGALAGKYGPRLFMAVGPFIAALGFTTMLMVDQSVNYLHLLPGILLFGLGLSITVAPLTSAILESIDNSQAGIGSAINNAVARIAGLVAIAAIGVVIGSTINLQSFHQSLLIIAGLLLTGGVISAIGIQNPTLNHKK